MRGVSRGERETETIILIMVVDVVLRVEVGGLGWKNMGKRARIR